MAYSSKAVANTTCGAGPCERPQHLEAVHAGHLHVEEDEVGPLLLDQLRLPRRRPGASPTSSTPPSRARKPAEPVARELLVVDDERAECRLARSRGLLHREPQPHDGAPSRAALDLGQVLGAVEALEPRAQVPQPDAAS